MPGRTHLRMDTATHGKIGKRSWNSPHHRTGNAENYLLQPVSGNLLAKKKENSSAGLEQLKCQVNRRNRNRRFKNKKSKSNHPKISNQV